MDALQQGVIAGAGLDVYEAEPALAPGLLDLSNVVLLPHMGSGTTQTRVAMGECAMANIRAFAAGEPCSTKWSESKFSRGSEGQVWKSNQTVYTGSAPL